MDGYKCALLASEGDIIGRWELDGGLLDLCLGADDRYVASYTYRDDTAPAAGYEFGNIYQNKRIGAGVFREESARGLALVYILFDGTLGSIHTQSSNGEPLTTDIYTTSTHDRISFARVGDYGVTCNGNELITFKGGAYGDVYIIPAGAEIIVPDYYGRPTNSLPDGYGLTTAFNKGDNGSVQTLKVAFGLLMIALLA